MTQNLDPTIQRQVPAGARVIIDRVLGDWDASNATKWPSVREIQLEFRKPVVEAALATLTAGAVYVEGDEYRASLLGMLSSSRGPEIERLLVLYLQYWRGQLEEAPKKSLTDSAAVAKVLALSESDVRLLGQGILLGHLWGGEHSPGGGDKWVAGVPKEMVDLMDPDVDLRAFINGHAVRVAARLAAARAPQHVIAAVSGRESGSKPAQDVPTWFPVVAVMFAALTLLFFMGLVVAGVLGKEVPRDSRFSVLAVLALGCGLSTHFLGGTAAARGRLPLPRLFKANPITFGATGGIAVTLIVLLLGRILYLNPEPAIPLSREDYLRTLNDIDRPAGVRLKALNGLLVQLKDPHLDQAVLSYLTLPKSGWAGVILNDAKMVHCDLRGAVLRGAKLIRANFTGSDLREVDFRTSELNGVVLDSARCESAYFDDDVLRGGSARATQFDGAHLQFAWLMAMDLRQASFLGADLTGATFDDSREEFWKPTDLTGADFRQARIGKADFQGTIGIQTVRFVGARFDGETHFPRGFKPAAAGLLRD